MPQAFRVPPEPCPHCGAVHDGAGSLIHDSRPKPGDVTVCILCAGVGEFTEDLKLRPLSDSDIATFDVSVQTELANITEGVRSLQKRRKR